MKLFDRNGNPVDVPDEQAQAALASGQYGAPAGTQIPVRFGGRVGSVPVEKLNEALEGGAEVVSQKDYEQADLQAKYGDAGHAALAAGTAALDTATLGLSNAAIGTIGGQKVRETLRKSEEANPTATKAGVGLGIVGPVIADIASGGAATPAVAGAVAKAGERGALRAGEKALLRGGEHALLDAGRVALEGGEAARVGETALARTAAPVEGELLQGRRSLPGVGEEMAGEVVAPGTGLPGPRALPSGVVPEVEGELVEEVARRVPRAAREEAVGASAVHDTPLGQQIGLLPESPTTFAKAESPAQAATRLNEAAKVVERAEAQGAVAEQAAAQAAGKGVVRQVVEGSLLGPQRIVTGGGQMVEDAVRGIIGKEAETAIGRIAQKAVTTAARGAFEGGAYGVGNEIGHQFLQDDPELNGERLASAWVHGAILGGAFGGALGAVSQGTTEAISKAVGKEGVADFLTKKAGEHMWHAAGPTQKMTAEANKFAGGAWKVGNLIRNDAVEILGRAPASREELLEIAPLIQEKHSKILDAVLDRLDSLEHKAQRPTVKDVLEPLEREIADLKSRGAPTSSLEGFRKRILEATGAEDALTGEVAYGQKVSFRELRNFRVTADEQSKFPNTTLDNSQVNAMRQVRRDLEAHIERMADKVADDAGGSLLKDYKAAKEGYQAGKLLEKAAARGKAAEGTNQFYSLTDKLMSVPGAMIGHSVAGPVGGFIAHLATEHASKVVRKNFDFVVSDVLSKLANVAKGDHVLNAAQKSTEQVQKRLDAGIRNVKKAFDGKEVERAPVAGPKTFEERREALLNAAAQYEAVQNHLNDVTKPLDKAAPDVAAALVSASLKTLSYLMDVLPKPPPPDPSSLTPQVDAKRWQPTDSDKADFNRRFDIATRPEMLPALLATGQVMPAHIETLQATSPKMLKKTQEMLEKELSQRTKPVPSKLTYSTHLVLGVPHVDPDLGRLLQSNPLYTGGNKPPKPSKPLKMADHTTLNKSSLE